MRAQAACWVALIAGGNCKTETVGVKSNIVRRPPS